MSVVHSPGPPEGAASVPAAGAGLAGGRLRAMVVGDLDAVLRIEEGCYSHPWSRGNFVDSLAAGHESQVLEIEGAVCAYFIALAGADEWHLLNLTVASAHQGRGLGARLLEAVVVAGRARRLGSMWLEVRASNARARALYARHGFDEVGLRRGYYPAVGGREDAILMRRPLRATGDEG